MISLIFTSHSSIRFLWYVLFAVVVIAAGAVVVSTNAPYDIDDAPITYRYAENLASGMGFVYNPGERVLGTSTPLYTLILAMLRLLGVPIPLASNVLNFLASVAVVAVTMILACRLGNSPVVGLLAGFLLLIQGSFLRYTMAGMETPLYTLLVVSALLASTVQRSLWAVVLAALAALMRLDGLVIVGAVLLVSWAQKGRFPLRELLVFLLLFGPWVLFAWLYFGSPLPLSMLAKQHHLQVALASRYWIWDELLVRPLRRHLFMLPFAAWGLIELFIKRPARSGWLAVPVWLVGYLVAYTVVGITFYEWYLMPIFPVLVTLTALGLRSVWTALSQSWPTPVRGIGALAGLVLLLRPYAINASDSVRGYREYLRRVEGTRVEVGVWLRENTPGNSRISAGAIGHVGYESGRYILDSAGLVTPTETSQQVRADYGIDGPRQELRCGPTKTWRTGWDYPPEVVAVWRCDHTVSVFGDKLTLSELQLLDWLPNARGKWEPTKTPVLETQWYLQGPKLDRDWTMYVHFTRPDGTTLAQADHVLGLQVDGSVLPTNQWRTGRRYYDYVALPEELRELSSWQIRVGVWEPQGGDRLDAEPEGAELDVFGRVLVPKPD